MLNDRIEGKHYFLSNTGTSIAEVRIYNDVVLKIETQSSFTENEYQSFLWLQGKLQVPEILEREIIDGKSYLLMTRLKGSSANFMNYYKYPIQTIKLMSQILQQLWSINIVNIPMTQTLAQSFLLAEERISKNLVDMKKADSLTFGKYGFDSPQTLLKWLKHNQPIEDLVLSHGDFTLSNVILNGFEVSGIVDVGNCALRDKWYDISICSKSIEQTFGSDFVSIFFHELGIEQDYKKIRYYKMLNDLL